MQFNSIFLTNAGVALINRAVSGTTVIWGECACTSDTLTASSTAIANRVCSGNTVAAFNDEEETVALSCSMDNTAAGLSAGNAVSFGIYAKIQGDENYVLVLYATSNNPMAIPAYSSDTTKVRVLLNLSLDISNGVVQSIAVTEPNVYALAQDLQTEINARQAADAGLCTKTEFNELASRVVTTNIQGDDNTGETQTIKGTKTFVGAVNVQGGFTSNTNIMCYSGIRSLYNNNAYQVYMQYAAPSLSTMATQGYARLVSRDSGQIDGTSIFKIGTFVSGGAETYHQELVRETRYQDFPSGKYWDFSICSIFREGIKVGSHIMPSAANTTQGYADVDVGAKIMPMRKVCAKNLYGDVGDSNTPVSGVYAERLHGVINYPTEVSGGLLVPVGAIVCLYGVASITGRQFNVTANTVYEGTLEGNCGMNYVTAGTYIALSSNASTSKTILAMRIA